MTIKNTPVRDVADHNINTVTNISAISSHAKRFFFVVKSINKIALHKAGNKKDAVILGLDKSETMAFSV